MLTEISRSNPDSRDFFIMKGIESFKEINWRHNGIGVLQGYVSEGGDESRFHIWHPDLVLPGMQEGGLYHDHRFDLSSHVVHGNIEHDELTLTETSGGMYEYAYVTHARAAKDQGGHKLGDFHSEPERTGIRLAVDHDRMVIPEGYSYRFPKFAFHGSSVNDLCITYVVKLNQEDQRARLLVPFGQDYTHAFANTKPRAEWEWIIDEAIAALRRK